MRLRDRRPRPADGPDPTARPDRVEPARPEGAAAGIRADVPRPDPAREIPETGTTGPDRLRADTADPDPAPTATTGPSDTGTSDTGTSDTGTSDTGTSDTGPARSGRTEEPRTGSGSGLATEELVLSYGPARRRPVTVRLVTGVLAVLVLLAVFVLGVRSGPAAGSGPQAVLELFALACVGFAGWALPGAVRQVLAGREAWNRPGPVLRLNREGVEFRAREGGPVVVFAPWNLVERCAFRPAPGGSPRWCVDAPVALPPSLSFAAAWAGMVPPGQVDDRVDELAATWMTLGTPVDRLLLRDALLFGTPIVVDLTRCPGVGVARLDAAVRRWTSGRCGCDPTEPPRPAVRPHRDPDPTDDDQP